MKPASVAPRTFSVAAVPPFRLDLTVWALRRRLDNTVDRWDGRTYLRALALETGTIELAAVQAGTATVPELTVTLTGAQLDEQTEEAARAALARLLGLELDLSPFYRLAASDPLLHTLAARFRGLKPPRFPTLFEASSTQSLASNSRSQSASVCSTDSSKSTELRRPPARHTLFLYRLSSPISHPRR